MIICPHGDLQWKNEQTLGKYPSVGLVDEI